MGASVYSVQLPQSAGLNICRSKLHKQNLAYICVFRIARGAATFGGGADGYNHEPRRRRGQLNLTLWLKPCRAGSCGGDAETLWFAHRDILQTLYTTTHQHKGYTRNSERFTSKYQRQKICAPGRSRRHDFVQYSVLSLCSTNIEAVTPVWRQSAR